MIGMNRFIIFVFLLYVGTVGYAQCDSIPNQCGTEIYNVANNQLVYKVCEHFGGFLGTAKRNFPIIEPTTEPVLTEDRTEFLESSWCNRNAHWSTFVFAGHKINNPLKLMQTVSEWREDLLEVISSRQKVAYMVTVPRLYSTDETPKAFFYNTHYFTLQVLVPEDEMTEPVFKIFAGFARHYRMIDYLQEWDINQDIPATHRLKMNRTTYAVEHFSRAKLEEDFLPRLELMMDEINSFIWTRLANDIHADLFYADKFKDMINMLVHGRLKPPQETPKKFKLTSLVYEPKNLVEVNDMTDGNNIVLAMQNETQPESPSFETTPLELSQVPPDGFYIPIAKPSAGAYYLAIRKYTYTDSGCTANADFVKRTCYGPDSKKYRPALPFKMQKEDYGTYSERESLPKNDNPSTTTDEL